MDEFHSDEESSHLVLEDSDDDVFVSLDAPGAGRATPSSSGSSTPDVSVRRSPPKRRRRISLPEVPKLRQRGSRRSSEPTDQSDEIAHSLATGKKTLF